MCNVNEELCQARMEKIAAVETDLKDVKADIKTAIKAIPEQDVRISLIEQQLNLFRWITGVIVVAVITLTISSIWTSIFNK